MIHLVTCQQPHFSLTDLSERGDGIDNVYQTNTVGREGLCYMLLGIEWMDPAARLELCSGEAGCICQHHV